ncbi:MAG: GNAT family N-acetyltransferase, partial [Oxalobacter sp.]|nr:GNAT family N-acetyltransferase [Oxalobacter sp.]
MNFHPISLKDNNAIVQLSSVATEIVKEHFDPIIGSSMNDYMIAMFQSVPAITQQLREGYRYWFVKDKDTILGFLAYYPRGDILYLSKFYLYKYHRNKGYAHQMLAFLIQVAKDNDLK